MFELIHHLFVWILSGKFVFILSIFWRNEISSLLPIVISGTQLFFNYILVKTLQLKDCGVMIVSEICWSISFQGSFVWIFVLRNQRTPGQSWIKRYWISKLINETSLLNTFESSWIRNKRITQYFTLFSGWNRPMLMLCFLFWRENSLVRNSTSWTR